VGIVSLLLDAAQQGCCGPHPAREATGMYLRRSSKSETMAAPSKGHHAHRK